MLFRSLLYDGVHNGGYFTNKTWNLGQVTSDPNGSGVSWNPTDAGALLPPFTHYNYSMDWNRHPKAKVGKVNVDNSREVALKFGIQSIPTVMVFKNGQMVKKWVGVVQKDTLAKELVG